MPTTTTSYIVYNHNGGGVRHHHFTTSNNIIDQAVGSAAPGDTLTALGFPSQFFSGSTVPFAFMTVHGAADGNHLYTSPGNQQVPVGTADISILVVYAPPGGIGSGGGPGVWVDAFNVDTGDFSDSDFIQVLTPPTPPVSVDTAKSQHANAEGDVSTVTAENLRAFASVDGAPFLEWKKITQGGALVTGTDVQLTASESGEIWFAFYQTVPGSQITIPSIVGKVAATLGSWTRDDYCGTPVPHRIGPNGPIFQISIPDKVLKGLPAANQAKIASYAKEYPGVALAAYAEMVKVQDILSGVVGQIQGKQR